MTNMVGEKLRSARTAQSLSLEQASQATHIREHYLEALEQGEMDLIPSQAQARGFLRSYASFLGLDPEQITLASQDVSEPSPPVKEPAEKKTPPSDFEDVDSVEAIHIDIGSRLRQQREQLGLSIEDVERHTHLRVHYLKALEDGDFAALPSPVQGRGMLNNYAAFLGLDPDPLMLRFAEGLQLELQTKKAAQAPTQPKRRTTQPLSQPPSIFRKLLSAEFLLAAFLVVALGIFAVWGAARIFAMQEDTEPSPTAPSIADVLLAPSTATQTYTPVPPTATLPILAQVEGQTDVLAEEILEEGGDGARVYVTVRQRTWVRVIVDGEVELEGRVLPGNAYQFVGNDYVEILTGNAAGLQIFYNQRDFGPLGLYGEVVRVIYTLEDIQTPTPTVTPTPTRTLRPSSTPLATAAGGN
ncbi:MAG: DUF4115 domain-containing protein [Anaerolineales bacterium]|nr:DUF4115 domain-containing protein [Anaerolineales bacterium]